MTRRYCLIDFETYSLADLEEVGAWRYAEDWSTEIICAVFGERGQPQLLIPDERGEPELLEYVDDPNTIFLAFNVQFEKAIWRHVMMAAGWPDIPNNRWHDIQASCAMLGLPLKLEVAGMLLGLNVQKDKEGNALIKAVSRQKVKLTPEVRERIYTYCGTDFDAEWALHDRVGWLPAAERKVWLLNQEMNERGLLIDLEYVDACQKIVDLATPPLIEEFKELTGFKPTQVQKVRDWCNSHGAGLENLRGETVEQTLEERDDLDDDVRRALEIRSLIGSASIKKLGRMKQVVNDDGRARGACQYHGTLPGRSAGRLFQPYNFPRGTTKVDGEAPKPEVTVSTIATGDPELVEQMIGPPVETVVSGLRHCIVAEKGKVIVSGDYAGIQARVVLAVAGQYDKTALMAAGQDVYIDMAVQIYKRPIDKKRDPYERQIGKFSVLGLGFGMGWRKFQFMYAKKDTEEFCDRVVQTYRKEWAPKVPKLWYGLEDAAARAVHNPGKAYESHGIVYTMRDEWLTCRLPSGRCLNYWGATPEWVSVPWDKSELKRAWKYRAWKFGGVRTIWPFGGSLTENIVMGIEVDIHRHGMQNLRKDGWPIVLEVYDEIVAEVPPEKANEARFKELMLDQPAWVHDLKIPINVDIWQGERYKK